MVDHRADNLIVITRGKTTNNFYIFGGRDESSQDLIQGITLAGVFFDEVALMPESFVNWSKWDGESEIASTATHHITLVECDQNYKAVRSGDVTVTVNPGA